MPLPPPPKGFDVVEELTASVPEDYVAPPIPEGFEEVGEPSFGQKALGALQTAGEAYREHTSGPIQAGFMAATGTTPGEEIPGGPPNPLLTGVSTAISAFGNPEKQFTTPQFLESGGYPQGFWNELLAETATDPLTWMPIGMASKGALKGGKSILKGLGKVGKESAEMATDVAGAAGKIASAGKVDAEALKTFAGLPAAPSLGAGDVATRGLTQADVLKGKGLWKGGEKLKSHVGSTMGALERPIREGAFGKSLRVPVKTPELAKEIQFMRKSIESGDALTQAKFKQFVKHIDEAPETMNATELVVAMDKLENAVKTAATSKTSKIPKPFFKSVDDMRDGLHGALRTISPEYAAARDNYRLLSKMFPQGSGLGGWLVGTGKAGAFLADPTTSTAILMLATSSPRTYFATISGLQGLGYTGALGAKAITAGPKEFLKWSAAHPIEAELLSKMALTAAKAATTKDGVPYPLPISDPADQQSAAEYIKSSMPTSVEQAHALNDLYKEGKAPEGWAPPFEMP